MYFVLDLIIMIALTAYTEKRLLYHYNYACLAYVHNVTYSTYLLT